MNRRVISFVPLAIFVIIAGYFYAGLGRDTETLPSALLNDVVPQFSLPVLDTRQMQSGADIFAGDKIAIINFFASWCVPCRVEHPQLLGLQSMKDELNIEIIGIAWKNTQANASNFLQDLGNPYDQTLHDETGRTGIDFGVYGLPETYIIDTASRIRLRHVGPILPETLENKILPAIRALAPKQ